MEATSVKRILVIDDNRAIHADFRKILCQSGDAGAIDQAAAALFGQPQASSPVRQYELEFACQGQEGLARVCESLEAGRPFALAFIDMRMPPGWDGLQTIEAIWKKDPDLQVVICTAYSDYSWSDIVTRLGASDRLLILRKPFDNAEVSQLATALGEKWRLARQARLKMTELEDIVRARTAQLQAANAKLEVEIGERKAAEEHLRHDALHDTLTGLANRTLLLDRLTTCMERLRRNSQYQFAVLFLDLDHFKVINDSLGHIAGDQLLVAVAQRLGANVRSADTVARVENGYLARLGGDEFVLLLSELRDPALR